MYSTQGSNSPYAVCRSAASASDRAREQTDELKQQANLLVHRQDNRSLVARFCPGDRTAFPDKGIWITKVLTAVRLINDVCEQRTTLIEPFRKSAWRVRVSTTTQILLNERESYLFIDIEWESSKVGARFRRFFSHVLNSRTIINFNFCSTDKHRRIRFRRNGNPISPIC